MSTIETHLRKIEVSVDEGEVWIDVSQNGASLAFVHLAPDKARALAKMISDAADEAEKAERGSQND